MTDDISTGTTIPDTPDASVPSPVNETAPDYNPFADDPGSQVLEPAPTPLMERMRLHFKETQAKGTLFGAARHFAETAVERGAYARGGPSDAENDIVDNSVKMRADLEAYERMPGAEGFLDYGAALAGQLAGGITSPEALVGNVFKVGQLAATAIGRVAEFGINQAVVQSAADPWIQSLNLASGDGTRETYDLKQTFIDKPLGGFVGGVLLKGAHEVGTAMFVRPQAEKDALTFFRMLRDHHDAADLKRWGDIVDAVQGKSDKQLGEMAKEIARDDAAAGDNAKPPTAQEAADKIAEVAPADSETTVDINGEQATRQPVAPDATPEPPITPEPTVPEPATTPAPAAPVSTNDATLIGEPVPRMVPHRVTTADGKTADVAPVVVEAADLKASSDPGYDPALQPRDRDRAASQAQITHISTRLDPERLGQSPEASHGAPIVGDDGMVESGNGRVMAIRDAYAQKGDAAQRYRDWLTSQGIDVSKYKEPILVRQRTTPMTPEERQAFTVAANQSTLLTMSAPERALADAKLISVNDLDLIAVPNDIGAVGNAGFIANFIGKLPIAERAALQDAQGRISQAGLTRVRDAIVARAYGDSHILIRIAESTNDDVKSLSNALVASAPAWARLRADVQSGLIRADMDITDQLIEAVSKTADLRNAGTKLDTFLAQVDAFEPLHETVELMMKMFYNRSGRRAASAADVAKDLKYYTEQAGKVQADAGLDLGMTPVMPRDILRVAAEKGFADERAKGETSADLFGGGSGPGEDGATPGAGEQRSGIDGGRDGHGDAGAGVDQGGQSGVGAEAGTGSGEAGLVRDEFNAASHAIEGALNDIERAVEAGDRKAVLAAGREAKKILDETPQHIKDNDAEYWAQFDSVIRKMTKKGYVVERGPLTDEPDALAARDNRSAAEKKYFDRSKPVGVNERGQTVYENKDGIRSVWNEAEGVADREGHSRYGDVVQPNEPRPERFKVAGDDGPALGDTLASQAEANTKADGALPVAVRPQEGSLSRLPEAAITRATLTSNFVDAPNIRALWQDLARSLGATVRAGRMVGRRAAGLFFTKTGVIRMRQLDDLTVFVHELGHHAEYSNKDLKTLIDTDPTARQLDGITAYSAGQKHPKLNRTEGFAEFFRLYVEHPAEAQRRAPGFYGAFEKYLAGNNEMRAALHTAQRGFDNYRTANAEDILRANVATSAVPKGWAKLRADVRNQGFWNTITDRGSMVYTGFIDENNALSVAVRSLLKTQKDNTGKIISLIAADDPYKLIRLASNAHQAGMIDMMHGVVPYHSNVPDGPSLHDAIALATGQPNIFGKWDEAAVQQFSSYLIARRGVFEWERRAAGLLRNDPMPFPKDMYEKEISVSEKANPNIKAAAEMVHEWTRNLLKKEFDAGLIKPDSYDAALKIRDYTPLMRDMSDKSSERLGGGQAFDAANVGIRQFRGSSRPIIDPLETLMERSFRTANLIAHNDAINALGNLAVKAGVGGGRFVERIAANELKARFVDPLEALRKGLSDNGVNAVDADLAITSMLNDLHINEQDMGPVAIFRSQQAAERGENIVFHLVGGELKALRLKEGDFGRELVMSLTGGLSQPLRDWNLQMMAKASQILRIGVTTSPDFFITNAIRDQMASWILNRGTFPLVNFARGVYREITNDELTRTFAQMGGIAGGANLNALDHARIDKDINALASKGFTIARLASFEGVFKTIELSETASRVGLFEVAYKRALKQGLSPYQASVEAAFSANDNLDFGRHGSRIGNTLKLIPFLNAQLQGLDKATRTLVSPLFKEKLTAQDAEAQKTMLSAYAKITALTGLSMALRANYIDDPEYSELSPYMRNTHWMVRIPGAKDNKVVDMFGRTIEVPPGLRSLWLAIPKPFELGIIPNMGERAYEMLNNKDPQSAWQWAVGAMDLVSAKTMMSSIVIKAMAEMYSGKDFFTGRDIVPEHLKGLEPWAQATAGTSALSKYIGDAANRVHEQTGLGPEGGLSPMYIDQLIKGVGGSQARSMLSLFDMAVGTKGDQSLADTAIAQRVFKEAYRGSTSNTVFWNQVAEKTGALASAANTYASFLSDPAKAAAFVAKLPEDKRVFVIMDKSEFHADEKSLHPLVNAHRAVTTITNMTREIADRTLSESASLEPIVLTNSEQRVALDALARIQMWTARNALIVSGTAALKGQKLGAIDADMEALQKTVPTVYDELAQRYANAKVYKASSVAEHWNEVKQSVIDDGSDAKLGGIAREVASDGFELDERRSKKKKVRPVIPGAVN